MRSRIATLLIGLGALVLWIGSRFTWLTVDTFEFCGGRLDTVASATQPVIDSASGMEQIQTEELPF